MLYPVCPTCGFLLADKEVEFEEELNNICTNEKLDEKQKEIEITKLIKKIGIERYCCKMRLISYVNQAKLII